MTAQQKKFESAIAVAEVISHSTVGISTCFEQVFSGCFAFFAAIFLEPPQLDTKFHRIVETGQVMKHELTLLYCSKGFLHTLFICVYTGKMRRFSRKISPKKITTNRRFPTRFIGSGIHAYLSVHSGRLSRPGSGQLRPP